MAFDFTNIPRLQPNRTLPGVLGIDFNDSTHPAVLEITSSVGKLNFAIGLFTKISFYSYVYQ